MAHQRSMCPLDGQCFSRPLGPLIQLKAGTLSLATTRCRFTLAPCLGTFIVSSAFRLSQNTSLLHFAAKLLKGHIKRVIRIHDDLAHGALPARSAATTRGSGFSRLITILAIDRTVVAWLKGNGGFAATTGTGGSIHRTCLALAVSSPILITT